jgi:tetratricopeptide (TPR) repeat protein
MSNFENANPSFSAGLTPPAGPTSASGFLAGALFAGRYRMVTRVGQGGMGEVWRADDLVLGAPVALKFVRSATAEARQRLIQEVRLARQITHPAVCRVFDVGEADGRVFCSMELVEGEDLATLVQRAGRLPQERVVDIGCQVCDGITAAHAHGVLHLDLKPANVLVDEGGVIRITDFGIAIARTDEGRDAGFGTPSYMAPEQLRSNAQLSERTDVYGIGLILYELLVGERAFPDGAAPRVIPPAPSTRVPGVDPRLDHIVCSALALDPADRPASAAEIVAALVSTSSVETTESPRNQASWLTGAALSVGLAILAVTAWLFWPRPGTTLSDQDTIVLAEVANTTGEPVFDGTLGVALAIALEQSPFFKLFPDEAVRDTLRLMERSPDEKVTRSVARDIALRTQSKALVAGSISRLGGNYVVTLEAVNAESGDVMAREQAEAPNREEVLTVLGNVTASLRQKLGESLASIQRFDAPLARATTPSLEALQAYSRALDNGRIFMRVEAIPHLKRAIDLDPDFALAHALLSGVYANTGQSAEAPPYARRAYELRDRVSERERYFISWRYYLDALQSWDRALELASEWTAVYPREAFAFNSLGLAAAAFGQHPRAVEAFREGIRIDPQFVPPHRNLAGSLIALNRFGEAKAQIAAASEGGISSIGLQQMSYSVAFVGRDTKALADLSQRVKTPDERMWQLNSEARAATFDGRFQAAHELFARAIDLAVRERYPELAARWTLEDAEAHAIAGQCTTAQSEVASGLNLARDNASVERAARALALCGDGDTAARLAMELRTRFPDATLTMRIQVPIVAATLALVRGDPAAALDALEPVKPYDHAPTSEFWPSFIRGRAYLGLNDGPAADAEFRKILDHRGAAPFSPLYALAQLELARAAALTGKKGQATEAYDAFRSLWQNADKDVQPLREGLKERAGLQ